MAARCPPAPVTLAAAVMHPNHNPEERDRVDEDSLLLATVKRAGALPFVLSLLGLIDRTIPPTGFAVPGAYGKVIPPSEENRKYDKSWIFWLT
jgi:hypothetical protein